MVPKEQTGSSLQENLHSKKGFYFYFNTETKKQPFIISPQKYAEFSTIHNSKAK